MDVIMVGKWMLSAQKGLDHGRHHGWTMEAEETPQNCMVSVLQTKETP